MSAAAAEPDKVPDSERPDHDTTAVVFGDPPPSARGFPPGANTKKLRADMVARAEKVWAARVAGATWKNAAAVGGYRDTSNAMRAVRTIYGHVPMVERDEQRRLWRDRLEVTWQQALRDMVDQKPGAVTAAVRVATCAAQLDGLNEQATIPHITDNFSALLTAIQVNVYGRP